ncbi:hypothetical protein BC826DRAFT_443630 [Russula brevipes]|nr:hypothetical protein BC826DRAFT_443630 [Russula brevipes]
MLPAFDADVLTVALPALVRFTLLADTLPYAFFDCFLPTRPHITHLALPHFVGVPPDAGEVPPAAVPALAALDTGPGLTTALAPGPPLQRVMLRVASTLYDGLCPAALFGALGGQLKELVLVLAPDFDVRTVAGHTGKDWQRAGNARAAARWYILIYQITMLTLVFICTVIQRKGKECAAVCHFFALPREY